MFPQLKTAFYIGTEVKGSTKPIYGKLKISNSHIQFTGELNRTIHYKSITNIEITKIPISFDCIKIETNDDTYHITFKLFSVTRYFLIGRLKPYHTMIKNTIEKGMKTKSKNKNHEDILTFVNAVNKGRYNYVEAFNSDGPLKTYRAAFFGELRIFYMLYNTFTAVFMYEHSYSTGMAQLEAIKSFYNASFEMRELFVMEETHNQFDRPIIRLSPNPKLQKGTRLVIRQYLIEQHRLDRKNN
jgi:hypothetical protein